MALKNIILNIIKEDLIDKLSSELKKILVDAVEKADERAKRTKNKYDDILVSIIKEVFNIE